jgi:plasmid stabilization system protein ParE
MNKHLHTILTTKASQDLEEQVSEELTREDPEDAKQIIASLLSSKRRLDENTEEHDGG